MSFFGRYLGSQHPSPNVKTLCNFEPQIWPEIITSRDARSTGFKGSRTSCDVMNFGIFAKFWPAKITSRDGCFLLNISPQNPPAVESLHSMMQNCPAYLIWEQLFGITFTRAINYPVSYINSKQVNFLGSNFGCCGIFAIFHRARTAPWKSRKKKLPSTSSNLLKPNLLNPKLHAPKFLHSFQWWCFIRSQACGESNCNDAILRAGKGVKWYYFRPSPNNLCMRSCHPTHARLPEWGVLACSALVTPTQRTAL